LKKNFRRIRAIRFQAVTQGTLINLSSRPFADNGSETNLAAERVFAQRSEQGELSDYFLK